LHRIFRTILKQMTVLCLETFVAAPIDRCFDLARDVEQHIASTAGTDERAVGGVTAGLLNLGDTVTWDARHFGVRWRLTSRITRLDQPRAFEDQQLHGPFATLHHTHEFESVEGGTRIVEIMSFSSPLGPLGRLVDVLVLGRYMRQLLERRNAYLKSVAERAEGPD